MRELYICEQTLARVLPESKPFEIKDSVEPTFQARVHPSGDRVFRFVRWTEGKRSSVTIGNWPSMTSDEARAIAARMLEAEKSGIPARRVLHEKTWARQTVGELFESYLELHLKEHATEKTYIATKAGYSSALGELAGKAISSVKSLEVQEWVNRLSASSGASTASKWYRLLKACLRWSDNHGLIELKRLPTTGVKVAADVEREEYLRPEQFPGFLAAVRRLENRDHADIILMLLYTGLRKSIILGMAWERIDLELKQWRPPKGNGNKRTPPAVALIEPAMEILNRRRESSQGPWVFPAESASGHVEDITKSWDKVRKWAELPDGFVLHCLRHSTASAMAMAGADILAIQRVLGHSTPRMTARYSHLNTDAARAALEKGMGFLTQNMPEPGAGTVRSQASNVVPLRLPEMKEAPERSRKASENIGRGDSLSPVQKIRIRGILLGVLSRKQIGSAAGGVTKKNFFSALGSQFGPTLNAEALDGILAEMQQEGHIETYTEAPQWGVVRYRLRSASAPVVQFNQPIEEYKGASQG
jgi:integrase